MKRNLQIIVSVSCLVACFVSAMGGNVLAQGWAQPPVPGTIPPPGAGQAGPEFVIPDPNNMPPPEEILGDIAAATPVIDPVSWDRSLEFGVSGSEGNSEVFNLRTAGHLQRTSNLQKSTVDLTYRKSEANGAETANLLFTEGRNEWLLPDKPCWSVFVHGTAEYDEFRDYNARVTADTGLGYYFVQNDISSLQGRFGGGFSREIGGMDDRYVPEGSFGLEASHQLTPRSKLTAKTDYFPDVSDFGDFRLNSSANWEILMDEVLDVSLKLGIIDRYDSTPGGKKANDLDYSAVLLWKF